jgi:hypothetical protein
VKKEAKEQALAASLLTLSSTQQICSYIVAGDYDCAAAEACDISHGTFMEWRQSISLARLYLSADESAAAFRNSKRARTGKCPMPHKQDDG